MSMFLAILEAISGFSEHYVIVSVVLGFLGFLFLGIGLPLTTRDPSNSEVKTKALSAKVIKKVVGCLVVAVSFFLFFASMSAIESANFEEQQAQQTTDAAVATPDMTESENRLPVWFVAAFLQAAVIWVLLFVLVYVTHHFLCDVNKRVDKIKALREQEEKEREVL